MCMLPSWGETEVGPVFLTDADIDLLPLELQSDAHGHKAIRYIYPAKEFREREGWADCPREMLDAMRAGKMDRIIRQSGVRLFFPRDGETISPKDHEVYIVTSGVVNSSAQTGGDCMANSGGVVNSSVQTGGDCGANSGGVVNSSAQAGGYCGANSGGVVNSSAQAGGDCGANSGGVVNSSAQAGGNCWANPGGVVNSSAKAGGYCGAFYGGVVNQIEEKKQ